MEREVGGGIGMGNTCKPMDVSFQCMTKSTTNKKKLKKLKKRNFKPTSLKNKELYHLHIIQSLLCFIVLLDQTKIVFEKFIIERRCGRRSELTDNNWLIIN